MLSMRTNACVHQAHGVLRLALLSANRLFNSAGFSTTTSTSAASFKTIEVENKENYAVVKLNRPKALNALSSELMHEVVEALRRLDADPHVRSIILTGAGSRAFAAGADIKEMATKAYAEVYKEKMFSLWDQIREVRKPIIAAVNGFALGGGCELAMMCDIILASETAVFGQPEVALGVIPGIGGTQRLTKLVGKAKAMELVLTGRRIKADEAERIGVVSRVYPADALMAEAEKMAALIAGFSGPVVAKAKTCINAAEDLSLTQGLQMERMEFWSCFALADQKEGMDAFVSKRSPEFSDS